ncbi:unnamed protein product [Peniophora sp. CBMAI 1063]|nr:unnamed protein product [Peniophora sp. CBMAI 1063]
MGYALWLVPSQDEEEALRELMRYRPPGSYLPRHSRSYPMVHPHITLATFDILPHSFHLRDIVPQEGRVKTYYRDLKPGNTYLGALSVQISLSANLQRLHQSIVTGLDEQRIQWKSHGFPHMSLFYVDEASERERLWRGTQGCDKQRGQYSGSRDRAYG